MTKYFAFVENDEIKQKFVLRGGYFKGKKLGTLTEDSFFEQYSLFPQILVSQPENYNPFYQNIEEGWTWNSTEKKIYQTWTITNLSLEEVIIKLKNEIASKRYKKEINGIKIDNYTFATDRQSQMMLTAVKLKIKETSESVQWKVLEGWYTLDINNIDSVTDTIFSFVEDCFNKERNYHNQIETIINDNNQTTEEKLENLYQLSTQIFF